MPFEVESFFGTIFSGELFFSIGYKGFQSSFPGPMVNLICEVSAAIDHCQFLLAPHKQFDFDQVMRFLQILTSF